MTPLYELEYLHTEGWSTYLWDGDRDTLEWVAAQDFGDGTVWRIVRHERAVVVEGII